MPEVLDFTVPKRWSGWWRVLDADGVLLCRVKAKDYDAALNKARNRAETRGKVFGVVPEE